MENREQQTIEEVLKKHLGESYSKVFPINFYNARKAVDEITEQLRQENKTLKEQLGLEADETYVDILRKDNEFLIQRIKELEEGISNRDSIMAEVKKLVRTLEQQVKELKD